MSYNDERQVRYEAGQNSNGVAACLVEVGEEGGRYSDWRCSLDKDHNGDHAAHQLHNLVDEPARITWPNKQYIITELEIV